MTNTDITYIDTDEGWLYLAGVKDMRERNEALDCRVYARAAAWILGADRWDEATWRRLEEQAGVETRQQITPTDTADADFTLVAKAGTPTTPRRKRRAYTPKFMRE